MTTIVINENTEEGRNLMGIIHSLRKTSNAIVRIFNEEDELERIPGIPCTNEELLEAVQQSQKDIKAGRVVPHEELKKQISVLQMGFEGIII